MTNESGYYHTTQGGVSEGKDDSNFEGMEAAATTANDAEFNDTLFNTFDNMVSRG